MLLQAKLLSLCFASYAATRFRPRSVAETDFLYSSDLVQRDSLSTVATITQDAAGNVPLFAYESLHLTTAEVQSVQALLQKQYGKTQLSQYWSLFDFVATNVTGSSSTAVNYTLAGPGNCKANATGNTVGAAACKTLTDNWTGQYFQNGLNDPIEMLSALYDGMTCQPPAIFNKTGTCIQGGYPVYVVNASSVARIQLAANFARNTGIRLVIKNTGHDFSEIANALGVVALGGECPTVGTMRGWIQGGGYSPVSSLWGMGADHALGFEVVTADGQFVTANRDQNPDLYWALRGGGGSTYGIVTSVILSVHEDIPVTSASWSFGTGPNVSTAAFSAALKFYYKTFPNGADNEIYAYFNIFNIARTMTFTMAPYFAPNKSLAEAQAIIQPWFDEMKALNVPVTPKWQTFSGFYEAYNASFAVEGVNNEDVVTASRMFPRANWANNTIFNATYDAFWGDIEAGMAVIGYNFAPTYARGGFQDTPVNPAWRNAIAYQITGIVQNLTQPASVLVEQRLNFTNGAMQRWRDLNPGSGAYLNEVARLEPNFQWAFWGSYYPRLLDLTKRYDPFNLFYAWTAVGSEFFTIKSFDGYPDENGRLCVNDSPSLYYPEGSVYVPH